MPRARDGMTDGGALAPTSEDAVDGPWPGWKASALALAGYLVALAVATWPVLGTFASAVPGPPSDPLQHFWIIHWSRACLLSGQSPYLCPDIQYPVGAPLGLFSPMHLETVLYTALGTVIGNEVLIYNLIWLFGFLGTGMGTFLLAWYVVRDRACAGFGGLVAMLSTPMMIHGQGHLELIQLGAVPVFLIAWLRFVDRPTTGRMLAAWAGFGLIAASAAYYAVLSTIPAAWYVAWRTLGAARRGEAPWLGSRVVPLVRFSVLVAPVLLVLFSSQLWAASHGFAISRSYSEFKQSGTPLWGYVAPTVWHGLGQLLPIKPYQAMGYLGTLQYQGASYLGVASLLLIAHAAIRRVAFPRSGYWWSALAVMAVLAMGATLQVGGFRVSLPASWLWSVFVPFRLIRVPARFNLLVCVVAAVIASAGLRDLRGRLTRGGARAAWFAVVAVAVADLTLSPFSTSQIPPIPPGYAVIDRAAPRAAILDAPVVSSGDPHPLSALCAYWQSRRGGRSTAGYSGHANQVFDQLFVQDSPFGGRQLADPSYLLDPARQSFGVIADVPFLDYAWLYLTVHRVDYVVLHHWEGSVHLYPVRLDRLMATFSGARIAEDEATTIYDRGRIPRPSGFVGLCTDGWISRPGGFNRPARAALPTARIAVYSPGPDRALTFRLRASSFREPRTVRLLAGPAELARWRVEPGEDRTYASPPFPLPEGIQHLTLASEGASSPRDGREAMDATHRPYSLRVTRIGLEPTDQPPRVLARP